MFCAASPAKGSHMELALNSLSHGLPTPWEPEVIILLLIGVLWVGVCGALPGVGSGLALGVALPLTFGMDAVPAVAFLVSISIGVQFGNGIPAGLLGVPGTPGSFLTAIDGYAMTRQGKTGEALGTMWFGGVFGQLAQHPVLRASGRTAVVHHVHVPVPGAVRAVLPRVVRAGEPHRREHLQRHCRSGVRRAVGGDRGGIESAQWHGSTSASGTATRPGHRPRGAGARHHQRTDPMYAAVVRLGRAPTRCESDARFPGFRYLGKLSRQVVSGSLIGTLIGAIPGMSGTGAIVMAYQQAKLTSKTPEKFGHGSEEGIAANESAGNASQAGELCANPWAGSSGQRHHGAAPRGAAAAGVRTRSAAAAVVTGTALRHGGRTARRGFDHRPAGGGGCRRCCFGSCSWTDASCSRWPSC